MGKNRLQLLRRQAGQRGRRQQDDRPHPSDDRRHLDERRFEQTDVSADVQPDPQVLQCLEPAGFGRLRLSPANAPYPQAASHQSQQAHRDPQRPCPRQPGRQPPAQAHSHSEQRIGSIPDLRGGGVRRAGNRHEHCLGPRPSLACIPRPNGRAPKAQRRGGSGRQQHQGQATRHVADLRRTPPQDLPRQAKGRPHEGALPERMQQNPSHPLRQGMVRYPGWNAHFAPPSISSSSRRISANSSRVAFLPARACMTSLGAEPANTRSSTCPTTWRCVCS